MHSTTERHCVRCSQRLTDAASMEVGIGPVCRKKDNKLLAQQFSANLTKAQELYEQMITKAAALPRETHETFAAIGDDLMSNADGDFRKLVKRCEYLLSWTFDMKEEFAALIEALGYAALAHIWRFGDGVPGPAAVSIVGDRLLVRGPRNRGAIELLREIPGRKWDPAAKAWSAPLTSIDAFHRAVATGYPVCSFDGGIKDWDELRANVALYEAKAPPKPAAKPAPKCTLTRRVADVLVSSPYNVEFVNEVRRLRNAKWDAGRRVWRVDAKAEALVIDLCKKHYGDVDIREEH
jgi:hypothetical protein